MRTESGQALKGVVAVAVVLAVVLAERRYQLSAYLSGERINAWLMAAGPLAPLVFIMVMALAVVVSPIPSLPLDVLAGKVFGPLPATLYAALGALLGAVISFQIARVLGRDVLTRFLKGHINFCPKCSDTLL
ncbi:MAG: VTT domain-containing protein, partial [Thermoanaerobaculia bacterium]